MVGCRVGVFGVLALALVGCRAAGVTDYRASPAVAEQDWGDRVHVVRGGVRVLAGPAAVFPYEREGAAGERERGRYQLFTRVVVHNAGGEIVEVLWSGAALELPGGGRVRLVDTGAAALVEGEGGGEAPELVERLEPGDRTVRALIPETVDRIEIGEPLVPLCDGCEYRLVLPMRIGGREERVALAFRLTAEGAAAVLGAGKVLA